MLGNMTPAQTLDVFTQQIAVATVFNDDKFVGIMKECRKLLKEVVEAQTALDERERELKAAQHAAGVVLKSQKTFTDQQEAAVQKLIEDRQAMQAHKDAVASDRKNLQEDTADEEARLKAWEATLKADQVEVDRVLKTAERKANALARVLEKEAKLVLRLEELGVREVA